MPSLADYQREVSGYLLDAGVERARGPSIASAVLWNGRETIHRNNYRHALLEALRHLFPIVERLVGPEFFAAMARAFIQNQPARSPALMDYGEAFPDFVGAFGPAASLAYLPDVARLELARHQVYHEQAADPLAIGRLTSMPPDRLPGLRLALHPAHRLLCSRYAVDAIWRANQDDCEGGTGLVLERSRNDFLVIRPRMAVAVLRLGPGDHCFVEALKAGLPIAEAAATALDDAGAFDLEACLRRLAGVEIFITGADLGSP